MRTLGCPFSVSLSGANKYGIAEFADGRSAAKLHWDSNIELQNWIDLNVVDFAEIFRGHGEATIRVRETGCRAAEGFDKAAITYERPWHLDRLGDQADLAFLIVYILRPKVVHLGTPCTQMCVVGAKDMDEATRMQNKFLILVCKHQAINGMHASVENPKGSLLWKLPE